MQLSKSQGYSQIQPIQQSESLPNESKTQSDGPQLGDLGLVEQTDGVITVQGKP